MRSVHRVLPLLAVAAGLPFAATANAAPVNTGKNTRALDVVMTKDGATHIARFDTDGKTVRICRIPAGSDACTETGSLVLPDQFGTSGPWIVSDGTKVVAAAGWADGANRRTFATTSTNGTAAYSPAVQASNILKATDVELSPAGDQLWITADDGPAVSLTNDYLAFAAVPIGSTSSAFALLGSAPDFNSTSVGGQLLGITPTSLPVAFEAGFAPNLANGDYLRQFTGAPGQYNDNTKWAGPTTYAAGAPFERNGNYEIASGSGRMWMAYEGLSTEALLRRYDGSFGTPVNPDCVTRRFGSGMQGNPALAITPAGNPLLAYSGGDGSNEHLAYFQGASDGSKWSPYQELTSVPNIDDLEIASDPSSEGGGVVAWTTEANADGGLLYFARLPAAAITGCPPPAQPPVTQPPVTKPPVKTPSKTKSVSATVQGGKITFSVPRSCVKKGKTFSVTLGFKKQKKKGVNFVKVTKVEFSVNGQKKKTDKKAPFRQTLRVKAGAKSKSKVTVRARAFIKVKKGKQPKKSLKTTITVC